MVLRSTQKNNLHQASPGTKVAIKVIRVFGSGPKHSESSATLPLDEIIHEKGVDSHGKRAD